MNTYRETLVVFINRTFFQFVRTLSYTTQFIFYLFIYLFFPITIKTGTHTQKKKNLSTKMFTKERTFLPLKREVKFISLSRSFSLSRWKRQRKKQDCLHKSNLMVSNILTQSVTLHFDNLNTIQMDFLEVFLNAILECSI